MDLKAQFYRGSSYLYRFYMRKKLRQNSYKWVSVANCLCGGEAFEELAKKDRYGLPVRICVCASCGLILQNPRLSDASLEEFYRWDYRRLYRGRNEIDEEYFQRGYRRGERIYNYFIQQGYFPKKWKILELGGSAGGGLKYFQEMGNTAVAVEIDLACRRYCETKGIAVVRDLSVLRGEKFQLIILSHFLEHVSSPVALLKSLREVIAADGFIYIAVPGVKNPAIPFLPSLQMAHLYYFEWKTLASLIQKSGFELLNRNEIIETHCRLLM